MIPKTAEYAMRAVVVLARDPERACSAEQIEVGRNGEAARADASRRGRSGKVGPLHADRTRG